MARQKSAASIVFLHVQKSGGSTVHSLLKSHFSEERFAPRDMAGHIVWNETRDINDMIVSGHVTAAEIGRLDGNQRIYTVLREPEERLLSHYYFLKSYTVESLQRFESPLLMRIKEMSLEEFLNDAVVDGWFRDFYLKNFDPEFEHGKERTPDLARALAFLESCDMVGTTNDLTAFVRALFGALDLPPVPDVPRLNSLASREAHPGHEPVEIKAPSPKERAVLREFTSQDRVLYELAEKLAPRSRTTETRSARGLKGLLQRMTGRFSPRSD